MTRRFLGGIVGLMMMVVVLPAGQAHAGPTIDGQAVVCDTFDQYGVNAKSVKWIGDYIIARSDSSPRVAVTMIDVAITMYCPYHREAFDDLASQMEKQQHPDNPLFN